MAACSQRQLAKYQQGRLLRCGLEIRPRLVRAGADMRPPKLPLSQAPGIARRARQQYDATNATMRPSPATRP